MYQTSLAYIQQKVVRMHFKRIWILVDRVENGWAQEKTDLWYKAKHTFCGVLTSVKVDWMRCKAAVCPSHCGSSSPTLAGILSDHLKSEFYSYVEHHYICKNFLGNTKLDIKSGKAQYRKHNNSYHKDMLFSP